MLIFRSSGKYCPAFVLLPGHPSNECPGMDFDPLLQ
jgi:hypothetical protein